MTAFFDFPPLGDTGTGPISPFAQGALYWQSTDSARYYVTHQKDHPAVAFRCHHPGGSSPCDLLTACAFIEWVKAGIDSRLLAVA